MEAPRPSTSTGCDLDGGSPPSDRILGRASQVCGAIPCSKMGRTGRHETWWRGTHGRVGLGPTKKNGEPRASPVEMYVA